MRVIHILDHSVPLQSGYAFRTLAILKEQRALGWETFHIAQLIPWIKANFRTYAEYDGRAVSGFSMGGFGALKYAAKYYGHFASVSSHSGPASLRRDSGLVVHWANLSSAVVELGAAETTDSKGREAIQRSFVTGYRYVLWIAVVLAIASSASAAALIELDGQRRPT